MPTFQDARDGLGSLLKEGAGNLSPEDRDRFIIDAGRTFSRQFPRKVAIEIAGNDGFEYALSLLTGFVDGFSTITQMFYPWDPDEQDPEPMERKYFQIFEGPSGAVLRFIRNRPRTTEEFLPVFTVPHALSTAVADVIGQFDVAGTVIDGADVSSDSNVATDKAADVQIYVYVTAAVGTMLDVIIQTSEDGTRWATIGAFREITGISKNVANFKKSLISKFVRLRYTTTGGSFTLEAQILQENDLDDQFTIPDSSFDAFKFLAAAISCQALADFYANLLDNQLQGQGTDYEGKAIFWQANHDKWQEKWEKESEKIAPARRTSAFRQGSWDLMGTTGFELLTHDKDHR